MEMQSTKAQHYVPRLYLKQWADEDEKIWCLDRENNRIFNSNIMGVAQERFFYEMKRLKDEDFIILEKLWIENKSPILRETNKGFLDIFKTFNNFLKILDSSNRASVKELKDYAEKNFVEKIFAEHERKYLELIKNILGFGIPNWDEDEKMSFLFLLNLQLFRTKKMSENLIAGALDLKPALQMDEFIQRAINPMRWLMANTVAYSSLNRRKFVFIENESNHDFVTTDQPVVNVYSILEKKGWEMSEDEFELYCPFSPKKAVLVSFKDCYSDMSSKVASDKDVNIYNDILVKCSHRFVFSEDKEGLKPWLEENQ